MKRTKDWEKLDSMERKIIDGFAEPWQRIFLKRFHELLRIRKLYKGDIITLLDENPNKEKLLPFGYLLSKSTLSESTNFKSKNLHEISVNTLIAISLALDVSADYLLGFDTLENSDYKNPSLKMILEKEIIEYILEHKDIIPDKNIKQKILQLEQYKKDVTNVNN